MNNKYIKLPIDNKNGNKSSFGKILIISGNKDMCGATILASLSALKSGIGYEYIYTYYKNKNTIQSKINESIIYTYKTKSINKKLKQTINKVDAILIGPGMGCNSKTRKILKYTIKHSKVPVVIDADGLNVLSKHINYLNLNKKVPIILTPHALEFKRLISYFDFDTNESINQFIKNDNIIIVLKNYYTTVNSKTKKVIINKPCSALAKAGSGDVLAGIIVSLIGQGIVPFCASVTGVYIHNKTGRIVNSKYCREYILPTDIINNLYKTFNYIKDN